MLSQFLKYIRSVTDYHLHALLAGTANYETMRKKDTQLRHIQLPDTPLTKELEDVCRKKKRPLLYSEYLSLELYGKYGFHVNSRVHGETGVYRHWPKALRALCTAKDLHHIVEFGPGDGTLACETIHDAVKNNYNLSWSGVEINDILVKKIRQQFEKTGLSKQIRQITNSLEAIKTKPQSLYLFPYSLDSIPVEVFLNTTSSVSFPNALLGIRVENSMLHEEVLTPDVLPNYGISFTNGTFTDSSGVTFDLTSWKLFPYQRVYLPIHSFSLLARFSKKLHPTDYVLIIDEFSESILFVDTNHLSLPHDLYTYKKKQTIDQLYKNMGKNCLYFPTYADTMYAFLHNLGFSSLHYDIEQKMAKELSQQSWHTMNGYYRTLAFLASGHTTTKHKSHFPLLFPRRSFV